MAGFRSSGIRPPMVRQFDPSQNLSAAGKLFGDIADRVESRAKDKAINELLSASPIVGNNETSVSQTPMQFQQQQQQAFSNIKGIDPLQALGLSNAQANPYFQEQSRQDEIAQRDFTNQYRTNSLDETIRHNQAVESKVASKGYGAITDDFGTTYIFNKDSGTYEPIVNPNASSGSIPAKYIQTLSVTDRDGLGNETITQVPIDKRTGKPINPEDSAVGSKAPVLSQADRDSASATTNALDLLNQIETQYDDNLVGLFDNAASATLNTLGINTKKTTENRQLNATLQNLKANLTAALIKGVPSDKDMAVIEDMLPSTTDNEDVFDAKMKNVKQILTQQQDQFKQNILNPRQQGSITGVRPNVDNRVTDTNTSQGSIYGIGTDIISF